jgi:hypothetical protein
MRNTVQLHAQSSVSRGELAEEPGEGPLTMLKAIAELLTMAKAISNP